MRLDMFLKKYPKIEGLTRQDYKAIAMYNLWVESDSDLPFEEYSGGISEKELPDMKTVFKFMKALDGGGEVGYWRKANAIHRWFAENVQGGKDDCNYHDPVTKEHLIKLRDICNEVLENHIKADSLLPTMDGFFFGSMKYDEYYFEQLKYTKNLCNKLIDTFDFEHYELYYVSSW